MRIILSLAIVSFCLTSTIAQSEIHNQDENTGEAKKAYPVYPDMLYEYRIAGLNKKTPVQLDYNESVRYFIELYSTQRREEFARILGLSELYFPIFDEYLDRYNLPLELKYLTIVESGLNPLAVSKSGATGLWQFLINTCRLFDLKVDSYIDERRDPYKSTEAACKYLNYLYGTFSDWQLVLSSYNGGPGDVRKAIIRSNGSTDYWDIRPYLSEQAQNYVPAFIAVFYLMHYYREHDIVPVEPAFTYFNIDTLMLDYALSFKQISENTGIPLDTLRFLNPVYKTDFIPESSGSSPLVLPADRTESFLNNESTILGRIAKKDTYFSNLENAADYAGKIKIIHVVEKGEFFHKIALKYNCTPENIKLWNNIPDNTLVPGQKLIIWVDKNQVEQTGEH